MEGLRLKHLAPVDKSPTCHNFMLKIHSPSHYVLDVVCMYVHTYVGTYAYNESQVLQFHTCCQ